MKFAYGEAVKNNFRTAICGVVCIALHSILLIFNVNRCSGYSTSCKQLKLQSLAKSDGEYKLMIHGRLVQVSDLNHYYSLPCS